MSFVVRGKEYPEHCWDCPFHYDGVYEHCKLLEKGFDDENPDDIERNDWHPDWCPLLPLPETFGDLVDRNALMERFVPKQAYFTEAIKEKAASAPVIIKSEG